MGTFIHLILQGTFYLAQNRSAEDDAALRLYGEKLIGVRRDSTFDVLYSQVGQNWQQQDDIVTSYGSNDRRWASVQTVWTFDLDNDVLRFEKRDRKLCVSLRILRERAATFSDFESYEVPPVVVKHALPSANPSVFWTIRRENIDVLQLQRHNAFISRILIDFAFQWRHILCSRYNNTTFRRLAYAIIRIITLDFTVEEITFKRNGNVGFMVWIDRIPDWQFANANIVRVGGISIVICQHVTHAVTLLEEDFGKQLSSNPSLAEDGHTYLILSVRELIVYRMNQQMERYTEPKRLFDGTNPPPNETIELLLEGVQQRVPKNALSGLPIEIQDSILHSIPEGPIQATRIGCLLNIGSIFNWRDGNRRIEREEGRRSRTPLAPPEWRIMFDRHSAGVAYK